MEPRIGLANWIFLVASGVIFAQFTFVEGQLFWDSVFVEPRAGKATISKLGHKKTTTLNYYSVELIGDKSTPSLQFDSWTHDIYDVEKVYQLSNAAGKGNLVDVQWVESWMTEPYYTSVQGVGILKKPNNPSWLFFSVTLLFMIVLAIIRYFTSEENTSVV